MSALAFAGGWCPAARSWRSERFAQRRGRSKGVEGKSKSSFSSRTVSWPELRFPRDAAELSCVPAQWSQGGWRRVCVRVCVYVRAGACVRAHEFAGVSDGRGLGAHWRSAPRRDKCADVPGAVDMSGWPRRHSPRDLLL